MVRVDSIAFGQRFGGGVSHFFMPTQALLPAYPRQVPYLVLLDSILSSSNDKKRLNRERWLVFV